MDESKVSKPSGTVPVPRMRRGPKAFLNEVFREMKRVTWPTRGETNRMTGVVLAICGLIVLVLYIMSLLVSSGLHMLLQKR